MMSKGLFIRLVQCEANWIVRWPCTSSAQKRHIVKKWEWHRVLRAFDAVPAHAFHICCCLPACTPACRYRYLCPLQPLITVASCIEFSKKCAKHSVCGVSAAIALRLVNLLISILIVSPPEIDIARHDICLWHCGRLLLLLRSSDEIEAIGCGGVSLQQQQKTGKKRRR